MRISIIVGILLFFSACNPKDQSYPNIVWLTTEDNSPHHMKLYNKNGVAMPVIEKLAKEGIVFDNAFSNAPVCSVARSTLITGCYAPRIFTQFHRRAQHVNLPDGIMPFPFYLRQGGITPQTTTSKTIILSFPKVYGMSLPKKQATKIEGQVSPFFMYKTIRLPMKVIYILIKSNLIASQTKSWKKSRFFPITQTPKPFVILIIIFRTGILWQTNRWDNSLLISSIKGFWRTL